MKMQDVERGEHTIWVSIVSLVEIMYLSEKNRIPLNLKETKKLIDDGDNHRIVDLGPDIVEIASSIKDLEVFDRLIVATAKHLRVPLLTSDREITEKGVVQVIWS